MKTTHGMTGSREFITWGRIIQRCCNPRHHNFKDYGARGITICDEWRTSFVAFFAHVGPRPSDCNSIERIDNNRGYEPGNVRWATTLEQNRNKRSNRAVTANGRTMLVFDWSKETGIHNSVILRRLNKGWSEQEAVTVAPRVGRSRGWRRLECAT